MPIGATCPSCRASYELADALAGQKVRCRKCQQVFLVPALFSPTEPPLSLDDDPDEAPVPGDFFDVDGRRRSSGKFVWLAVGLAAGLLGGVGVAAALGVFGPGKEKEREVADPGDAPAPARPNDTPPPAGPVVQPAPALPPPVSGPAGWKEFASAAGKYRALLPGTPATRGLPMPQVGPPIPFAMPLRYVAEGQADGLTYSVTYYDMPPAPPSMPAEPALARVSQIETAADRSKAPKWQKAVTLDGGHPGQELLAELPAGGVRLYRAFAVPYPPGSLRAFVAAVSGPKVDPAAKPVEEFFKSLRVEGAGTPLRSGPAGPGPFAGPGGPGPGPRVPAGDPKAPALNGRVLTNGHRMVIPLKDRRTINDLAFSPDGKQLAVACAGTGAVWIYEAETGKDVRFLTAKHQRVNAVAFSPDGVHLVLAGGESGPDLELWDAATWKLTRPLLGHEQPVQTLAFHPKGRALATGGADKMVRVWNLGTGEPEELPEEHKGPVTALAYSDDGRWLASGSWDRSVRVFDVAGKSLKAKLPAKANVRSVAFHPKGDWLAVGTSHGPVQVWDWAAPAVESPRVTLTGHAREVLRMAFRPGDGKVLATGGSDGTVRLWHVSQAAPWLVLRLGDAGGSRAMAFSPDGKALAVGTHAQVLLFDVGAVLGRVAEPGSPPGKEG